MCWVADGSSAGWLTLCKYDLPAYVSSSGVGVIQVATYEHVELVCMMKAFKKVDM